MAKGKNAGCLYTCLFWFGWLSAIATHLYCCWLAYVLSTFWQVLVTFCTPILSEIYWFVKVWQLAGGITWFNLWVIGTVVLLAVGIRLFLWSESRREKKEKAEVEEYERIQD